MAMTLARSGLPAKIPSVPANTSASIEAAGNVRLMLRMSGVVSKTSPSRRNATTSTRGLLGRRQMGVAQHGATDDADAEHIEPALAEIEQMRIDQRGQKILHDDDGADPGHQSGAAKQQNMGGPHRQQHRGAEDTELD